MYTEFSRKPLDAEDLVPNLTAKALVHLVQDGGRGQEDAHVIRLADVEACLQCPITQERLSRAVTSPSGMTCERDPLSAWLQTKQQDPMNCLPLSAAMLRRNRVVARIIAVAAELTSACADRDGVKDRKHANVLVSVPAAVPADPCVAAVDAHFGTSS